MARQLMSIVILILTTCGGATAANSLPQTPLKRTRFLVLDSRVIETVENAKLTLGKTVKSKHNPLMAEDKPWEKRFDNLYANVFYDQKEKLYKCWYSPFIVDNSANGMTLNQRRKTRYRPPRGREMAICYAVSKDGIKWEKPELGLVEFEGSKQNNIVWRGPHGAGVFKDLRDPDPARRYKTLFKGERISVAFSADGIHWGKAIPCPEVDVAGDTHNNALWVPTLGKYVGITRTWGNAFLCMATLRPDGFASYEPIESNKPARITTTAVVCTGGTLQLSADVPENGSIKVAVLDKQKNTLAEGEPITTTVTDAVVRWKKGFSFERLKGNEIRLQFELRDAKLYSFSMAAGGAAAKETIEVNGLPVTLGALPDGLVMPDGLGLLTTPELTCEYAVNPLGVDTARPRFGWVLQSNERGQMQSAYQILVAGSEEKLQANVGDKWDSGKVDSDRSVNVDYGGKALASGEKCYWKVRVWGKQGQPRAPTRGVGRWSKPGSLEMGLLKQSDWKGQWIGFGSGSLTYVAGKLAGAVQLDGEGQTIKIAHDPKLKPTAQITISAWIKPAKCTDHWREIYRKDDGDARHLMAIGKTGELFGLWCGLGIDGSYVERGARLDKDYLGDGHWHLVAATYDGTSIKFFADGRQVGSAPLSGPLDTAGSSPAYIGSSSASSEFFPGGIDDVRIYNRALSPEQIRALAKGGDPQPGPDHLAGWWKLDGNLANSAGGKDAVAIGASPAASPLLRKEFTVTKDVRRARVYISGIGFSELYLNGQKVSDHVLDPAATDYDKRVLYVTHDVTDRLKEGRNALGVMLGNGWYCEPGRLRYGDSPRVLLQMQIEHVDGSTARVTSGPTWKTIDGPIRRNDFWNGEVYDARLERSGWTMPDYDDSKWAAAAVKEAPGGFMQSQLMPAIKVNQTLRPVKLTNPKPGVYVYDLGQFFGGWARLRMRGRAGTTVAIGYSAHLLPDSGVIDRARYRSGGSTDHYTLKGGGEEIYEPRFTYHPVRYVQVEGYPGEPTIDDLQGRVTYSDVDLSSRFECSNPVLNRIHQNVHWTLTNGLFGMPLDCLYREHWAWTDPATITGSLYPRKHMPLFWTKWLEDIAHAQQPDGNIPAICPSYPAGPHFDPAWGGNYPMLVWYLYQYLDDERMLRRHYTGMRRCVDYHTSIAEDHTITRGSYGDHMLPGRFPGDERFISQETPPPLVWTGYYYRGALVISQAARLLGKTDDAKHYAELAGQIKRAFNRKWLDRETHQYATGSQTANLLPLALQIVPQDQRSGVLENIVDSIAREYDGHLHTGNTGTTCMIDTLAAEGHGNLMVRVATAKTYPGWGYMVGQDATTIWESWGKGSRAGGADSMIMWATIDEFFYNDLAGIRGPEYYGPGQMVSGFRQIEIRPHVVGDLTHARARVRTVRGVIAAGWKKDGHSLTLDVTIPAGSRAKVSVPTMGLKNVAVAEGGQTVFRDGAYVTGVAGISGASQSTDYVTFDLGSGAYSFRLTGQPDRRR